MLRRTGNLLEEHDKNEGILSQMREISIAFEAARCLRIRNVRSPTPYISERVVAGVNRVEGTEIELFP